MLPQTDKKLLDSLHRHAGAEASPKQRLSFIAGQTGYSREIISIHLKSHTGYHD